MVLQKYTSEKGVICLQEKHDESKSSNSNDQKDGGRPTSGGGGLDKLSKEELVAKCRHLLAIAQKAKTAKDGEEAVFLYSFGSCLFMFLMG